MTKLEITTTSRCHTAMTSTKNWVAASEILSIYPNAEQQRMDMCKYFGGKSGLLLALRYSNGPIDLADDLLNCACLPFHIC